MKYGITCFVAFALLLCFSRASLAHRVNIFGYADGDAIQVECYFSKNQKVRSGKLTFTDPETGVILLEGTTDEQGLFRFRPDAAFLKTGHGVNILLNAGEGHQNHWLISLEELRALSPPGKTAKPAMAKPPGFAPKKQAAATPSMDAAEVEALVGRVMDARLVPIKQTLARQEDSGPFLKDIIGALGWIFGLVGIAMHMKYRR